MRQHACQHIWYRVMKPQVLIEHLKIVGRRGEIPLLVGLHVQPRRAVVSRRLGEYLEAGVNPISIRGRRIDSRFTPQRGSYVEPNRTAERSGVRQGHAAKGG